MRPFNNYALLLFFAAAVISSCAPSTRLARPVPVSSIRYLDEYRIAGKQEFQGSIIGGLSGIDFNEDDKLYYLICDDPSAFGPARFYTADIRVQNDKIDTIIFRSMVPLLDSGGNQYPDIRKDRPHSADVEAMRYDRITKQLIRSTEGQRVKGVSKNEYQQPEVVRMNLAGQYLKGFTLPNNLHIDSLDRGPRHNSVLEGLSFRRQNQEVLVALEDALYDDGARAATGDSTAWSRVTAFNMKTGLPVAQYAYPLDAVPHVPVPAGAFKINGVSDILHIGGEQFIFIERGWATGSNFCQVRVYLADFTNASDVSNHRSLREPGFTPVTKRLLLNMDDLQREIYNIEGVCFGPRLSNGNASLLFIADDNFNEKERGQVLLFEVVP